MKGDERDVLKVNTVNNRHNRITVCVYNYSFRLPSQARSLCGLHLSPIPPNDTAAPKQAIKTVNCFLTRFPS